jgi:hypothetical protein
VLCRHAGVGTDWQHKPNNSVPKSRKKAALTEHIRTAPAALGGFMQELLNHRQESIRLDKERSYCDRKMHLEPAAFDSEFNSRAVLGRT